MAIELTFCVVNTEQRELLGRCLDAIAGERRRVPFETEVLVLDNASEDGSVELARAHPAVDGVVAVEGRTAKSINDSELLRRARGRYGLLLNEDSELAAGASEALWRALEARPRAGAAVARLVRPDGRVQPSAWRFPTITTALAGALFLHRRYTVQSRGEEVREVDWAQSAALLVRTEAAAQVGYLDPEFFVYGEEVDFCRRLHDAGWSTLYVPGATAIHHEQLVHGRGARAAHRRVQPQPRALPAKARAPGDRPRRPLADRLDLCPARPRRPDPPRSRPASLLAPRHGDPAPGSRRRHPRGRGSPQSRAGSLATDRQCDAVAHRGDGRDEIGMGHEAFVEGAHGHDVRLGPRAGGHALGDAS